MDYRTVTSLICKSLLVTIIAACSPIPEWVCLLYTGRFQRGICASVGACPPVAGCCLRANSARRALVGSRGEPVLQLSETVVPRRDPCACCALVDSRGESVFLLSERVPAVGTRVQDSRLETTDLAETLRLKEFTWKLCEILFVPFCRSFPDAKQLFHRFTKHETHNLVPLELLSAKWYGSWFSCPCPIRSGQYS